ncbi:MAG TPA: MBOAT family O-acyltransferase [Candidatus Moranbacteria bacterium]|nr:MBOAT family O-acyltransferase [Candidatus Moranbacteria bacterium]
MPPIDVDKIINSLLFNPQETLVFNSGFFLFLFFFFLLFYSLLRRFHTGKIVYITAFSYYFYYKAGGWNVLLLPVISLINFYVARWMNYIGNKTKRKFLLAGTVTVNLGILGYFKYTNFFIETFNQLNQTNFALCDIILPLGISFYVFQAIAYIIDVFRKNIEPVNSFVDFCFFISFFPKLLMGPIEKARNFIPQIFQDIILTDNDLGRGIFLIMCGIFKKIAIADYIGFNFVNRVFSSPLQYSGLENLLAVYGYALQIYCDFSGYADIAIGLALLIGYKLMDNFNAPYQSFSITEFWRRWHISLSTWLKDYLYISMGGNRRRKLRLYLNLWITMLLAGLWHGASWNFIFWGAGHGFLLVFERFCNLPKLLDRHIFFKLAGVIVTFHLVCFLWIFFRADSFATAWHIITQIFYAFNGQIFIQFVSGYKEVCLLMFLGYLLHFSPKIIETKIIEALTASGILVKIFIVTFFIWAMIQIKSADIQQFIYFQF